MAVRPVSGVTRCVVCGGGVLAQNESRYCSNACRQRAYRARVIATSRSQEARRATPPRADGPGALPAPLDSFIGRKQEITRIGQLFRRHRLVTLVGPAGVGKSRLAIEFAGSLPGARSGSVAMVLLDAVRDGDLVGQAVATALGVREQPDEHITETVFAALRSAKVLLLDNCEHLVEPCAEFLATALRRCGELRVLATSREALNIAGEAVFNVDGMSVTAPGHEPVDAGRLFVDRARALVHDFAITKENAADVLAICTELDGNPLAIELAARWVPVMPVRGIREHLSRRFELLSTNRRATQQARQVHRSLREAIDWGYELLDDEERKVFRRLTVLTGGFDETIATVVCADAELPAGRVLPVLGQLRAKSLLSGANTGQFRLLESIRLYGRQRLEAAGEAEATRERLISWLVELGAPLVREPMSFTFDVLAKVAGVADNLFTAVGWTAASDDPRNAALSIATAMGWSYLGHITEGRKLLATALNRPGVGAEDRCRLLCYAGTLAMLQSNPLDGIALLNQALALSESIGSVLTQAGARYALGTCYSAAGRLDEAEHHLTRTVTLTRAADQPAAIAIACQGLAWLALVRGEVDRGAALIAEAIAATEGRPPIQAMWRIYCTVGAVAIGQGDDKRAVTYFTKALREKPQTWLQLLAVEGIAVVAQRRGQFARAVGLIGAADAIRHADEVRVEPFWGHQVKESFAVAEQALGQEQVERIAAQTRHLTMAQLIAYAVDDVLPEVPVDEDRDRELDDGERRVAVLAAEGLTNEQIARRLGISARTVAYRLRQVRGKLSLNSRTEIRTWIAENPSESQ